MISPNTAGCLYMDFNARSTLKDASNPSMRIMRASVFKDEQF